MPFNLVEALKKLKGGELNKKDRKGLRDVLQKAIDKLEKEDDTRLARTVLDSCDLAGYKELHDPDGIFAKIFSKGSLANKNLVKAIAHNGKNFVSCVDGPTYLAAKEFARDIRNVEGVRTQHDNFLRTLIEFNETWNDVVKMHAPFVTGAMNTEYGDAEKVEGCEDGKQQPNTCEAQTTEQGCEAMRSSLYNPPGSACLWLPNFKHLEKQASGHSKSSEFDTSERCVSQKTYPFNLRDMQAEDVEALRLGRQFNTDDKSKAVRHDGPDKHINLKRAIDYTGAANDPQPFMQAVSTFGQRRKVPYFFEYDSDGKVQEANASLSSTEKQGDGSKAIQRFWRKKMKDGRFEKFKNTTLYKRKFKSKFDENQKLVEDYMKKNNVEEKQARSALLKDSNSKYMNEEKLYYRLIFDIAKSSQLDQADVNFLIKDDTSRDQLNVILSANDETSLKQKQKEVWDKLLKSASDATKAAFKGKAIELKAGGEYIPVQFPPARSEAAKNLFVVLEGGAGEESVPTEVGQLLKNQKANRLFQVNLAALVLMKANPDRYGPMIAKYYAEKGKKAEDAENPVSADDLAFVKKLDTRGNIAVTHLKDKEGNIVFNETAKEEQYAQALLMIGNSAEKLWSANYAKTGKSENKMTLVVNQQTAAKFPGLFIWSTQGRKFLRGLCNDNACSEAFNEADATTKCKELCDKLDKAEKKDLLDLSQADHGLTFKATISDDIAKRMVRAGIVDYFKSSSYGIIKDAYEKLA